MYQHVYNYHDEYKTLMKSVFYGIEFLKDISIELFHRLIYSFHDLVAEQDEHVLRVRDPIGCIIVVLSGTLEFTLDVDGIDFVIFRAKRGTVINSRNCFANTRMYFKIKCTERAQLKIITSDDMEAITRNNQEFSNRVLKFVNQVSNQVVLLDYIPQSRKERRQAIL